MDWVQQINFNFKVAFDRLKALEEKFEQLSNLEVKKPPEDETESDGES